MRQLLAHQAGLFAFDEPVDRSVIADLEHLAAVLARQKPAWPPGTCQAYHAITLGYYEGELLRRIDPRHRSLGQFFQDEIAAPLGLEVYIRLPDSIPNSRLATLARPSLPAILRGFGIRFFLVAFNPRSNITGRYRTYPVDLFMRCTSARSAPPVIQGQILPPLCQRKVMQREIKAAVTNWRLAHRQCCQLLRNPFSLGRTMNGGFQMATRRLAAVLTTCAIFLVGCASGPIQAPPEVREALAPTGTLRVGVLMGTPGQMIRDPATGETKGVSYELGRAFAQRLGIPFEVIPLRGFTEFNDAMKAGRIDFGAVNATPARAAIMDFAQPHLRVESGFLVPPDSSIRTIGDVDRKGVRVGVTRGSTTEVRFSRELKNAVLVPAPSVTAAIRMFADRQMDTYATNKANLFEMADKLPGFRVLDGRFDVEQFSIAIPKGREAGMSFLRQFVDDAKAMGLVAAAAKRAGLRGLAND